VRNGQKTLTEFISDSATLASPVGILNNLVKGSNLSTTSEIQNVSEIVASSSKNKQNILSYATTIRDASISLRENVFSLVLILLGLMLANVLFLQATRRNPLFFVFRACFAISIYTVVFCAVLVFAIGGTSYFSSLVKEFLLPGFINTEVLKLVSGQLVTFTLDLVFPAFVIAFGLFIFGLVVWSLNRLNVFVPKKLVESGSRIPNHRYKKLFRVPEESILRRSSHTKKLELLKTYSPGAADTETASSSNQVSNLTGQIGDGELKRLKQESKINPTADQPDIVISESHNLDLKTDHEETRMVRRVQL
jgi:hypothetical protein